MPIDSSLSDIVLFEVPGRLGAADLLRELASSRLAWIGRNAGAAVVGVLLNPNVDDLAVLLRRVEHWAADRGLVALRFEVDGETYVLQPTPVVIANTAA